MPVSEGTEAGLAAKFAAVRRLGLSERQWRQYLGIEARALGRGGIAAVARAAEVPETMVAAGVPEVGSGELEELPRGGRGGRAGAARGWKTRTRG